MKTGNQSGYDWLESDEASFGQVLRFTPELVRNRCVAITSFDSGPLHLTPAEIEEGWSFENDIAHSPQNPELEQLPWDSWDEWYVFATRPALAEVHVFVNYGVFRFGKEQPHTTDWLGDSALREQLEGLQLHFWDQLQSMGAETYIAQNDRLLLATRVPGVVDKLSKGLVRSAG